MKRRIKAALAILLVAVLFMNTGCQLALEDAGEEKSPDRLIGVFITRDYLDLFDMESYLTDRMPNLTDGAIRIDPRMEKFKGRIYASFLNNEYIFESMEGVPFYCPDIPLNNGQEHYVGNTQGEELNAGGLHVHVGDDEENLTLDGTIYVAAQGTQAFYFNPVYQSADGRVYLTGGQGIQADIYGGASFIHTQDETTSETENGKTKTRSMSIKIEISVMEWPERIVLMQMDTLGVLLSREEYVPGTLPETIKPYANAAYLITETQHKDGADRKIYDRGEESIETFNAREDGICIASATSLVWGDNENKA